MEFLGNDAGGTATAATKREMPQSPNGVPGAKARSTPSRLSQLDFLRTVAIALVLSHHMVYTSVEPGRMKPLYDFVLTFGWTGLDLFFVLSGFLIGGLLFNEIRKTGQLNASRFLIRRGLKIWPLYYGFLILCTVLIASKTGEGLGATVRSLWSCYLNVQNFDFEYLMDLSHRTVFVAHVWTLAVEEHFYLGLPLLLLLLTRNSGGAKDGIKWLPLVCISIMALCLVARLWVFGILKYPHSYSYHTPLRIDGLFSGVMLAYLWYFHHHKLKPFLARPLFLMAGGLLCLAPMTFLDHEKFFTHTLGYTLLYIGYGLILLSLMSSTENDGGIRRFFNTRFARFIAAVGAFSYPIYLFHMLCFAVVDWFFKSHLHSIPDSLRWFLALGACLGLSCGVGIMIGLWIEKPLLAVRNKLFPA
jgi:peptidoglycan/LPS O-acetylase OafA/YrhL